MRATTRACALLVVTALSLSLVAATPLPVDDSSDHHHHHHHSARAATDGIPHQLVAARTLAPVKAVQPRAPFNESSIAVDFPTSLPTSVSERRSEPPKRPVIGTVTTKTKKIEPRALDKDTAGGNAYSGAAGDVSGGAVGDVASDRSPAFVFAKRTSDADTTGGNAYTGNSGDVSGGSINNAQDSAMPVLLNLNSNNAGQGGTSASGCASGGHTNSTQEAGGNAYSGSAGDAQGGNVVNPGGMMNINSNNAGNAGTSQSGCATGGNVGQQVPNREKTADFSYTPETNKFLFL